MIALAALMIVVSFAPSPTTVPTTQPTESPAARTATKLAEDVEEVRLSAGREGEYDAVIADLGLEGAQLEAFKQKDADRLASLRAFIASERGKQLIALREQMAAARREKRTADVAPLRAQIKPLSDQYWAVRNEGRRQLMRTLTEPQLQRVAGAALYARVARSLAGATPTAEQRVRTRAVCDEAAAAWFTMSMLETDPYLQELTPLEKPTREHVFTEVLTAEQRDAMKRPVRPPAAAY